MTNRKAALVVMLALLAGCSSATSPSNALHPDVTIKLNAQGLGAGAFAPNPITISLATKQTVRWGNADYTGGSYGGGGVDHTITSDSGLFGSGQIAPRSSYSFTFTAPGTYNYHCSNHPTMVGTVIVTN